MQARDAGVVADDRCGSFSTELGCPRHVRFTPDSDRTADIVGGPFRARLGHGDTTRSPRRHGLEAWEANPDRETSRLSD
jgi:hypothetical protein